MRHRRSLVTLTVTAVLFPLGLVGVGAGPAPFGMGTPPAGALTVTGPGNRYTVQGTKPSSITPGPDGALWFTEWSKDKIGRITVSGHITRWTLPTAEAGPTSIVAGPDGNLWFVETGIPKGQTIDQIGRITPSGSITQVPINGHPYAITAGPDGNLWFTAVGPTGPEIGRASPGGTVAYIVLKDQGLPAGATVGGIAAGPDGNLWFTTDAGEVGRITTSGSVTLFNVPGDLAVIDIAAGPDGNLWFTTSEAATGAYDIGRCTPTGAIKLFAVPGSPTTGRAPWDIAAGPDGNVWFTLSGSDQIGRISTASWNTGQITEYSVAINGGRTPAGPHGITTGPNGDIWFTDWTAGQIAEYPTSPVLSQTLVSSASDNLVGTAAGPNGDEWVADDLDHMDRLCSTGTVQQYTLSTFSQPYSVAEGPYPHRIGTNVVGIWFTEAAANKIGVFPEAASNIVSQSCGSETPQQFTIPTPGSKPLGITPGPDGALWFTEFGADKIGRVTTAGAFSEFPLPTANAGPLSIVTGPDGNLWFTEYNANQIGRITPAGVVTEFKLTTPNSKPDGIAAGPDGNLWFTEYGANRIGRIAPTGAISWWYIPTTTTNSEPDGIVTGPDGNLWFTMINTGRVGRITPQGEITSFTLGAGHPSAIAATTSRLEVTDAVGADGELATVLPPGAHAVILPSGPAPATITVPIGTVVEWTQLAPVDQSISDTSGMGLFKSTSLFPGSDFSFRFAAAGTYSYAATPASTSSPLANGTVKVSIQVTPTEVTLTYTPPFAQVTWAASPPPKGYRYDVQVEEPGSTYVDWLKGTMTESAAYYLGSGTYLFRSRVRNTANGDHSNWSPPEAVTVYSTTLRPAGH